MAPSQTAAPEKRSWCAKPSVLGSYRINNIPIGCYSVSAKLAGGKALKKMKLSSPIGTVFGMSPAESTSTATVFFKPSSAQASMVSLGFGSWEAVGIGVEKQ